MKAYFAVGDAHTALRLLGGHAMLFSFAYVGTSWVKPRELPELAAAASELMIDSGAFSTWSSGKPPTTVDRYLDWLANEAPPFAWALSLDVIGDAARSLENWRALVGYGAQIVPVWHEGDPLEHLDEYDPGKRLVALGRIEGRRSEKACLEFYDDAFNAYPDGRFHALGNSNPGTLEPYPFESFDATSWQRNAAYGNAKGFPWSHVSKDTRMRVAIEAIENIEHKPKTRRKQLALAFRQGAA